MDATATPPYTGRHVKGLSGTPNADLTLWRHPDVGALSRDGREDYYRRKKAIQMYLQGESEQAIYQQCKLKIKHVYRLIRERCLETHADGLIYGWRGLVPGVHIHPYRRKSKVRVDNCGRGASGALHALLEIHIELHKKFDKRILSAPPKDQLGSVKRPRQAHWKWFLDELRKLGIEIRNEWPFNTKSMGYHAISRYVDKVQADNPEKAARAVGGPDAERKMIAGDGVARPVTRIFQRVEMDAHKIDGIFCVLLPHSSGGYVPKVIHRLWVIVILEIVTRVVLGYYLSLRFEVNKEDVLRAISNALSVWKPKEITLKEVKYIEGAGFPSSISPKLQRVCWDETSVDGALAETCKHVREVLRDVVGSKLITPDEGYPSRRSKDDRPFIEAFFKNIASRGFQRLSNTTGGKAGGTDGRSPEKVAIKSEFQYEYAEELLDVLIANYNANLHSGLGYRSPLQQLKFLSEREGVELRYADIDQLETMLSFRKLCTVHGSLKEGKKPYVNFCQARYTSEILAQRYDLVGEKIWVVNHIQGDARVALASQINGMPLGTLRALPPWHKLPHSLEIRRAVQSCLHNRQFMIATGEDAIESFLNYCELERSRKLPIHPSYLQIRRLLAQEGALMQESDETPEQDSSNPLSKSDKNIEPLPASLPARRMARTS